MEKQNNGVSDSGGNVKKFRDAMNAHAEKVCGIPDAFSMEQAADMLKTWTEQQGGDEELAVARMCELAYGLSNIALRDAFLIINSEIEKNGAALYEDTDKVTIADVFGIIARHWHQFSKREKAIISSLAAGDQSNVKPASAT